MKSTLSELWKFFIPYLKSYKGGLFALCLFPIIWCFVETIAPFLIKIAIDSLSDANLERHQLQSTLWYIIGGYMSLMLVLEVTIRACNYVWIKTFPKIRRDLQARVLNLVQNHDYSFFHTSFSGDLVSRYRNLTDSFEAISRSLLYGFYPALLSFIFSLAFIAIINIYFSAIFLLWFLAMNLVGVFFYARSILASQDQATKQNTLFGHVGDFLSNPLAVMSYPQSLTEEKEFQRLQNASVTSTQQAEFVVFQADTWRSIFSWILLASMILFLSFGWQRNWITLGDFSFVATVCFYVRRTIWMASVQLSDFFKELGRFKEALSLIKDVSFDDQDGALKNRKLTAPVKNSIVFSQVCFGYNKDKPVFHNFSLEIPAGQKLGVTGASGIGKTSLIHLLLRFYEPQKGTIKVNNNDYRDLPIKDWRNTFSYVPQNPVLLHRSIFDNILFGNPLASKNNVFEAARVCLCDEFIHSLDKGYDTVVGEGGYKLSGGQRQRIALARAYLKKAPVFILDEATSALDLELEERLLDQLCHELEGHTIILVSHRISSLQKMERVITLDSVGNLSYISNIKTENLKGVIVHG